MCFKDLEIGALFIGSTGHDYWIKAYNSKEAYLLKKLRGKYFLSFDLDGQPLNFRWADTQPVTLVTTNKKGEC
jgi:hypothetical protein